MFCFYILEKLFFMFHTFIIQIFGFPEFLFSSYYMMGIAFIGYVLTVGQIFFGDATVITNLLSHFPSLIEFECGGYYVYNPTLKRFFVFHFLFPFLELSWVMK